MNKLFVLVTLVFVFQMGCNKKKGHEDGHHGHKEKKEKHDDHKGHDDHRDEHKGHADNKDGHDDHKGHDEHEEGVVHLSPQAYKRSGISTAMVSKGSLNGTIKIPAEVRSDPDYVAHISPLVEGKIESVDVKLGDVVTVGQKLVTLRSLILGRLRADLSRTTAHREVSKQTMDRQEKLRSEGINSKRALIEAQHTYEEANAERKAVLSQLRVLGAKAVGGAKMDLVSPIAGTIIERHATRGENASSANSLFVIADLSKVWIIGRVYEQQIAQVRKGMTASVTLAAYPSRTWEGKIDFIGAVIEEDTRTLPIRVELENSDGILRPGLFGSLRLSSPDKNQGMLVPTTSVQIMENKSVVFVETKESGKFKSKIVTIGRQGTHQVEILSGLDATDKIVVEGAFILKSELMRAEMGDGHNH